MNWIKSRYRITFGAAVILDFGELVDDDIKPAASGLFTVVPLIRAAVPLIRDGKNPSYQFSFQVQRRVGTALPKVMDVAARASMWDGMIAWAATDVQECLIEVQDSGVAWKFEQARITAYNPQVRPMEMGRTLTQYSLVCAGLKRA